MSKTMLIS